MKVEVWRINCVKVKIRPQPNNLFRLFRNFANVWHRDVISNPGNAEEMNCVICANL